MGFNLEKVLLGKIWRTSGPTPGRGGLVEIGPCPSRVLIRIKDVRLTTHGREGGSAHPRSRNSGVVREIGVRSEAFSAACVQSARVTLIGMRRPVCRYGAAGSSGY